MKIDKEYFIKTVTALEKKLYVIARSRIDNEEDVKDIIQETIYLSYKNINKLKDKEKLPYWIVKILLNNCNRFYKNKENMKKVSIEDNCLDILSNDNDFDKFNNNMDFFKLLNLLSDAEERTIFSLYYVEDCTTNAISKMLEINENTIKSKLKRARDKIRIILERFDRNE